MMEKVVFLWNLELCVFVYTCFIIGVICIIED